MPELSELPRLLSLSLLSGWFLLSLVRQIDHPSVNRRLRRVDPFHLITPWRLFNRAPLDCRIWLRERDDHGAASAWYAMDNTCGQSLVIWNPSFRPTASRHVLVLTFVIHLMRRPSWCSVVAPWGRTSPYYRSLENYIRHLPAGPLATERQFSITLDEGRPGEDAFYLSDFFAVARAGRATAEDGDQRPQTGARSSIDSSADPGSERQ